MEILAPCGNIEILKAAIQAGCDAVYISGKNFGARKFAPNFTNEEIIEAVRYAHLRCVKVYVTINTIVYDHEFNELDSYLKFLDEILVDAVIVQDLGVVHYIRKNYPNIIIHASTQMNVHNVIGAKKLLELGIKRVVLARETDIDTVKEIISTGIEVEVFAHGALCYSYSGQCLMSYSIGGRSGNRGECAQPCRKKYTLYENGEKISNECSLLSMKDLNTLDYVKDLFNLGVTSLKIEGRMKSISYVTSVVKIYKNHLNNIIKSDDLKKLSLTFNRDFVKGYLFNNKNHDMTNTNSVNHQGVVIGKVLSVNKYGMELILDDELEVNDGIRIKSKDEIGFYVNNFKKNKDVYFIEGKFNVRPNDLVYKTVSNKLNDEANNYLKSENYSIDLSVDVNISLNNKLSIKVSGKNTNVTVNKDLLTEIANKPLSTERIIEQVKKTDSTLLYAKNVNVNYDGKAFVKISDINSLRREAISKWVDTYLNNYQREKNEPYKFNKVKKTKANKIEFDFICHTLKQYNYLKNIDFINAYYFYGDNNLKYISHFHKNSVECANNIVHNLSDYQNDAILSISSNIVNSEALELLNQYNLSGVYLSSELSEDDMIKLSKVKTNYSLGTFIYGRSLMLVSKHCFISKLKGINKIKCGSCLKNSYYITDQYNNEMPVFSRCNDEPELIIYNYKKKNNINLISKYQKINISRFLFVITDEDIDELKTIINNLKKESDKCGTDK